LVPVFSHITAGYFKSYLHAKHFHSMSCRNILFRSECSIFRFSGKTRSARGQKLGMKSFALHETARFAKRAAMKNWRTQGKQFSDRKKGNDA
jgi:hypothetical protein